MKVTIIKRPLKENDVLRKYKFHYYQSEITSSSSQLDKKEKGGLETIWSCQHDYANKRE